MFVHSVYFWLKPDLSEEECAEFRVGLESLEGIRAIEEIYIGTPAETDRPVIDKSYTFGLNVVLKDMAAHDAYQSDPLHKNFIEDFGSYWAKVVIYDFD